MSQFHLSHPRHQNEKKIDRNFTVKLFNFRVDKRSLKAFLRLILKYFSLFTDSALSISYFITHFTIIIYDKK